MLTAISKIIANEPAVQEAANAKNLFGAGFSVRTYAVELATKRRYVGSLPASNGYGAAKRRHLPPVQGAAALRL